MDYKKDFCYLWRILETGQVYIISGGGNIMNITDIRIRKIEALGKMKAIVSVTFDDMFVVHDMKVIEGQSGLFIAMPSRKTPSGEYKDIAHPINSETRELIQQRILKEYESMPEDMKDNKADQPD
jgi:stage V sporulation protein G